MAERLHGGIARA